MRKKNVRGKISNTTNHQIPPSSSLTFTRHFKYLGSYISYNLRDDHDVDSRIAAASASIGSLSSYWSNKSVDLKSKYLIFAAISSNLLLWGS